MDESTNNRRPAMSRMQRVVWDAVGGGLRVRYWPSSGISDGHFSVVDARGAYVKILPRDPVSGRGIPHTTIPAMVKKGFLVQVRTFKADATGRPAYEYARAPEARAPAEASVNTSSTPDHA